MTADLSHRARGGVRHVHGEGVALVLCRPYAMILPHDEQGHASSADGAVTLVMDGRLDNRDELSALLLQHRAALHSREDAALVLAAYEAFGEGFLRHVDGDFAIVIWDSRRRSVLLARDRFGVRPLFYHLDGHVLSFASEVRPVLDLPWVPKSFNHCAALRMMSDESEAFQETLWSGIERVQAGRWITVSSDARRAGRYWEPETLGGGPRFSEAQYIEGYRALLDEAVSRMSRSDHPIAIEASGGLDSSAIAAIAHRQLKDSALPAPSVLNYTLAFENDEAANDLPYARELADFLGTSIIEVEPSFEPLDWYVEQARKEADFPGYPNGVMGHGIGRDAAAAGCRVLLSGIGGDEILSSGSYRLADALQCGAFLELVRGMRDSAESGGFHEVTRTLLRGGIFPLLPAKLQTAVEGGLRRLLKKPRQRDYSWFRPAQIESCRRGVDAATDLYQSTGAGIRQLEMIASLEDPFNLMARELENCAFARLGLEIRYPFLYRPLVEYCLQVPLWLKERNGQDKWFHRQAMKGLLPEMIRQRSDKAEFSVVYRRYADELVATIVQTDRHGLLSKWIDLGDEITVPRVTEKAAALNVPDYRLWMMLGCLAVAAT